MACLFSHHFNTQLSFGLSKSLYNPASSVNNRMTVLSTPKAIFAKSLTMASVVAFSMAITACDEKTANTNKSTSDKPPTASFNSSASTAKTQPSNVIELLKSDVIDAKAERFQPSVPVTGTLQANERTQVQSTVSAQVIQIFADVGKAVKQGDRLVALDNRSSKDQLAQAQADVAAAQAQARVASSLAQKNKVLLEQGFVSQIEYERSVADATAQQEALKARQAQLNSAKRLSGDTIITAPSSGVVSQRNVQVGQVVSPNQPLMDIVDPTKLEFAANIPSEAQSQISVGQHVPFTVSNSAAQYIGQVKRIAPQVDPTTRQLTVYIAVKSDNVASGLRAGMYATGQVEYGQLQVGVLVPMSAVTLAPIPASTPSDLTAHQDTGMVWVIGKDQLIRRQPVRIVRRDDAHSQYLIDGIEQGTVVVLANLTENDKGKKAVLK